MQRKPSVCLRARSIWCVDMVTRRARPCRRIPTSIRWCSPGRWPRGLRSLLQPQKTWYPASWNWAENRLRLCTVMLILRRWKPIFAREFSSMPDRSVLRCRALSCMKAAMMSWYSGRCQLPNLYRLGRGWIGRHLAQTWAQWSASNNVTAPPDWFQRQCHRAPSLPLVAAR